MTGTSRPGSFRPAERRWRAAYLLASLLGASSASGVEGVRLGISSIRARIWSAGAVEFSASAEGDAWRVTGHVGQLSLPPPLDGIRSADLVCPKTEIQGKSWVCSEASFHVAAPWLDRTDFRGGFSYEPGLRRLHLSLDRIGLAGGQLRLSAEFSEDQWHLSCAGSRLNPGQLLPDLRRWLAVAAGTEFSGRLDVQGEVDGRRDRLQALSLNADVDGLRFAEPDGRRESKDLHGRLRLAAQQQGSAWQARLSAALDGGLLYVDPILLDFAAQPVTLDAVGSLREERRRLTVSHLSLTASHMLELEGTLGLDLQTRPALTEARLDLRPTALPSFYKRLLQPWLVGTPLDALDAQGDLRISLDYGAGDMSVRLDLAKLGLGDQRGRFGISGLAGTLSWRASGSSVSKLQWDSGHVYRLPFGGSEAVWEWNGDGLRLLEALRVPILGGSLRVNTLQARGLATPSPVWDLDGIVTPVDMPALSRTLGWPAMAGQLSAVIPRVHYAHNVLDIGGAVLFKVFDGEVVIRDLRLARPLGLVPELGGEVELKNLDLRALTQAFAFGTITGRLEGTAQHLRLEDWEPVVFDASFRTPPAEGSAHRIDQRAVKTLSSLGGGGMSAALSQGLLSLFDTFYYKRLGLACRLARGVCEMGGIAPAPHGGYYIVQGGGGLPTLDVIGYTRRVDWKVLVERLRGATQTVPKVQP